METFSFYITSTFSAPECRKSCSDSSNVYCVILTIYLAFLSNLPLYHLARITVNILCVVRMDIIWIKERLVFSECLWIPDLFPEADWLI